MNFYPAGVLWARFHRTARTDLESVRVSESLFGHKKQDGDLFVSVCNCSRAVVSDSVLYLCLSAAYCEFLLHLRVCA